MVLEEIKKGTVNVAKNCLPLFNEVCDMKNDGFRQIYTLLHQAYLQHDLFEECISLYEKNGWLNDLTATLINKIYEEDQEDAMIGRVLRSAQSVDDLSNLLSSEIAKSGPSEAALLVLD